MLTHVLSAQHLHDLGLGRTSTRRCLSTTTSRVALAKDELHVQEPLGRQCRRHRVSGQWLCQPRRRHARHMVRLQRRLGLPTARLCGGEHDLVVLLYSDGRAATPETLATATARA